MDLLKNIEDTLVKEEIPDIRNKEPVGGCGLLKNYKMTDIEEFNSLLDRRVKELGLPSSATTISPPEKNGALEKTFNILNEIKDKLNLIENYLFSNG